MLEMQDAYRDVGGRTVSGTTVEQFPVPVIKSFRKRHRKLTQRRGNFILFQNQIALAFGLAMTQKNVIAREPQVTVAIYFCIWRIDIRETIGALYLPLHHAEIRRLRLNHRQHRPVHDSFTHYVFHEELQLVQDGGGSNCI